MGTCNIPTRTGYKFLGWSVSSSAKTVDYYPSDVYQSDLNLILYAVWEEKDTVTPDVYINIGDPNGDTQINAKDALEVLKVVVGKVRFTKQQQTAADVNKDETVDAKDALEILKYSVGKPSVLG